MLNSRSAGQFVHVQSIMVACYGEIPPGVLMFGGVCRGRGTTPRWPDMVVPFPMDTPTMTPLTTSSSSVVSSGTTPVPFVERPSFVELAGTPSTQLSTTTTTSSSRTLLPGEFLMGDFHFRSYNEYQAIRFPIIVKLSIG